MSKRTNPDVAPTPTKKQKLSHIPTTQPETALCCNSTPVVLYPFAGSDFCPVISDILDVVFDTCSALYQFVLSKTTRSWYRRWKDTATRDSFYAWTTTPGSFSASFNVVNSAVTHCILNQYWDLLDWMLDLGSRIQDTTAIYSAVVTWRSSLVPRLCSLGFTNGNSCVKVCNKLVKIEDLRAIKALDESKTLLVGGHLDDNHLARQIVKTGNKTMIEWFIKDHIPKSTIFDGTGKEIPLFNPLKYVAIYTIIDDRANLLGWLKGTFSFIPNKETYWRHAISNNSVECLKWLRDDTRDDTHEDLTTWDKDGWPVCVPSACGLLKRMKFDIFKFAIGDGLHYNIGLCHDTLRSMIAKLQRVKKDGNYNNLGTKVAGRLGLCWLTSSKLGEEMDEKIEKCISMSKWIDSNLTCKWSRQ